jgi:hypothetical protein
MNKGLGFPLAIIPKKEYIFVSGSLELQKAAPVKVL